MFELWGFPCFANSKLSNFFISLNYCVGVRICVDDELCFVVFRQPKDSPKSNISAPPQLESLSRISSQCDVVCQFRRLSFLDVSYNYLNSETCILSLVCPCCSNVLYCSRSFYIVLFFPLFTHSVPRIRVLAKFSKDFRWRTVRRNINIITHTNAATHQHVYTSAYPHVNTIV